MALFKWALVTAFVLNCALPAESKNVWGTRNNQKKNKEDKKKSAFEILQERHLQADDATDTLLDSMNSATGDISGIDLLIHFLDKGLELLDKPDFFELMLNVHSQVKATLPQIQEDMHEMKGAFGSFGEEFNTIMTTMWDSDVTEKISQMKTVLKDLRVLAEELLKAKGSKRRLRSVLEKFPEEAREYVQLIVELDIENVRMLLMGVLGGLDPMEQMMFKMMLAGDFDGVQKMMRQYLKDDERLEKLREILSRLVEGTVSDDHILLDKAKFKQFVLEMLIESAPTPRQDTSM